MPGAPPRASSRSHPNRSSWCASSGATGATSKPRPESRGHGLTTTSLTGPGETTTRLGDGFASDALSRAAGGSEHAFGAGDTPWVGLSWGHAASRRSAPSEPLTAG